MASIKLRGRDYPLHLSLNAVDQIQKRYGNVEKLSEKMRDVAEMPWIIALMINEGLKLEAYENGTAIKQLTPDMVGTFMSPNALTDQVMAQSIIDCVNESLGGEKNLTAEDAMQIYAGMISQETNQKTTKL